MKLYFLPLYILLLLCSNYSSIAKADFGKGFALGTVTGLGTSILAQAFAPQPQKVVVVEKPAPSLDYQERQELMILREQERRQTQREYQQIQQQLIQEKSRHRAVEKRIRELEWKRQQLELSLNTY